MCIIQLCAALILATARTQNPVEAAKTNPSSALPTPVAAVVQPTTPGDVMVKSVEGMRSQVRLVLDSYAGLAPASTLANWLGGPIPTNACDLARWSHAPVTGDMPLIWNTSRGLYEVSEKAWREAPSAIQRFTWYYLRAYSHLPASLRKTHSFSAVGPAALIAADVVYPENFAVLPDDVVVPATGIGILNASSPGLVEGIVAGKSAKDLVTAALARLCAVGENASTPGDFATADMLSSGPWERAVQGDPLKLENIMPSHPLTLSTLQGRVLSIPHLTVRLMAQAAVAQARFTPLPIGGEQKAGWEALAAETTTALKADNSARKTDTLAPSWTPGGKLLASVPQSLRPAGVILLANASHEVFVEWDTKGATAAETKLKAHPAFLEFCAITGQEPVLQMASKPELRGQTVFLGKMTFRNLVRVEPAGGRSPLLESVVVDLIAIPPTGDGEPIRGFSAGAYAFARMPGKSARWIVASELVTGMEVLGHLPVGDPNAGIATRLDEKVRSEWFTISKIRRYENVKGTVIIAFAGGWRLAVAMPQHVLLEVGKAAIWVDAVRLDAGYLPFAGAAPDKKQLPVTPIKSVQETDEPQQLVSLALSHDNDELAAFANNLVLAKSADGTDCATVECTSGDVSMVVETEMLTTKTGRTPLKDLVENPACKPDGGFSIVSAFFQKPAGSPWNYPPFLPGEAYVSLKSGGPLTRAIRLVVKDPGGVERDFVCSRNTKMRTISPTGQVVPRRAFNAKVGETLVSSFAVDGSTPIVSKVVRIEELTLPEQQFISLVLVNLNLAQCGPLLVEWESRQEHMFNMGVARESLLALSKSVQPAAPAAAQPAPDLTSQEAKGIVVPSVCVGGSATPEKAVGEKVAAYDPPLNVFGWTVLGSATPGTLTRALTLKAGKTQLKVAGSQSLLVRGKDDKYATGKLAYLLMPGDMVFIAEEGAPSAVPVPLENVVPSFACDFEVTELGTSSSQGWHNSVPVRSDICLANHIATLMKAPGFLGAKRGRSMRVPDDHQPGISSGEYRGANPGTSPERRLIDGASVPELNITPANRLDLSDEAKKQFTQRARMISQEADQELAQVHSVSRGGKLQLLDDALQPGKWPYDEAPGKLSAELRGWVAQAIQQRGEYLAAPSWSDLPKICLQNVVLAAWLDAAGCPRTATLFARDAIEFSILAGCSEKAVRRPELSRDAGLGLVLASSKWAAPNKDQPTAYAVNPLASRAVSDWAAGLKMSDAAGKTLAIDPPVPKDGIVELDGMFMLWAIRAGEADVNWPDLDNPQDPRRSDFTKWLSQHGPQAAGSPDADKSE